MRNEFWNGKGRDSQHPYTEVAEHDAELVDCFGRSFTIPKGSECKHFETLNKGWIIWKDPDGKGHVRDIG